MQKHKCPRCGYIYDPEVGRPDKGTKRGIVFEDLPDDWRCPEC
ncbi:MAG: rubredoxin, partial [Planctomycetota bacterium]